jgi:hypothetical protein
MMKQDLKNITESVAWLGRHQRSDWSFLRHGRFSSSEPAQSWRMLAITSTDPIDHRATPTENLLSNSRVGPNGHPFTNLRETKNAVGRRPQRPIKGTLPAETKCSAAA